MSSQQFSSTTEHFNKLIQFRQAAYGYLGNARDALFELSDAVIQMREIQSFAELSCAPAFRRKWSSVYEALQDGRPDRAKLMELYLQQLDPNERLLLVGDHTAWSRLWADTLSGRSYVHQPTPIPGRRPITMGQGYSTLAVIPEEERNVALPLLHERIADQKPIEAGAEQLCEVCEHLLVRPLSLWDSEYGCAAFLIATKHVKADKLFRLRTNLCLEGPTKPYKGRGPHPKHGLPFKFLDPDTWWEPERVVEYEDPKFGKVKARQWRGLRFKRALDCPMIVVQVERLQASGSRRKPRILWFGWSGEEPPERWWPGYGQRYRVDHWYRFAKGRLHWTQPMVATPEQGERWSDLMPLITWELWFARQWVKDTPLPWQKPMIQLSMGRVCQGMQNILMAIGTPTRVCKPRGKSPGWPEGRPRAHRPIFEIIRSKQWKQARAHRRPRAPDGTVPRGRPKKDPASQAA